jgi:pimeloyl-ACP methyl ester carboxylesterase
MGDEPAESAGWSAARVAIVGIVALAVAVLPTPAAAQIDFCGPSDRACGHLSVPLDYTHQVAGTVKLAVERAKAKTPTAPPLFLLAGGPGQSATDAYSQDEVRAVLDGALRTRDVVVFDQRGTGESGVLRCPALERATDADVSVITQQCAAGLGPGRAFYRSADSAADLEAVRSALGYPRIGLLAVSYGTKVALDYAATYPARVDRMVLDSVVPPEGVDPLYRASFRATRPVLRDLCRRRCDDITPDPVRDVTRLVGRLRQGPLNGTVITANGDRRRASLTEWDLFSTLVDGDLDPFVRARFPAAVRSASLGDSAPLFRLANMPGADQNTPPKELSAATFAATVCEESPLPWDRGAPFDTRLAQVRARVAAEPAGAFAPFDGAAALGSDVLNLCSRWPASPRAPAGALGPLPDVPVLVLSGAEDMRTPSEDARRVASLFPKAQLVIVRGVAHSVIGSDLSDCSVVAVRRFLKGRRAARTCSGGPLFNPTPRDPVSLRDVRPAPGTSGRPGRTIAAVRRTYQDALQTFFQTVVLQLSDSDPLSAARLRAGGLRAGLSVLTFKRAKLRNLVYVPGVRVSGRLNSVAIFPGGVLRVRGPAAAHGTLRVHEGVMSGELGGRHVRASLGPDIFDLTLGLAGV